MSASILPECMFTVVNTKPLHGIQTGSPMVVTLGQQYNTGEKHTVVMLLVIGKENTFTLFNESTKTLYDVYSETVVLFKRVPRW